MLNVTLTETAGILGIFGLPGHWEIVIIILAILLLFGGKKLPELARGLGRGLRLFRSEVKGLKDDVEGDDDDNDYRKPAQSLPPTRDSEQGGDERAG